MKKIVALDIETTGLNPRLDRIHGVGLYDGARDPFYYSFAELPDAVVKFLGSPDNDIVGHNIRFDLKFLISKGIDVKARFWDTKILAQLINENRELGLKPLVERYFGKENLLSKSYLDSAISEAGVKHVGQLCALDLDNPKRPYTKLISHYCKEDCINTYNLWTNLIETMKSTHSKMLGKFEQTIQDYFIKEAMPIESVLMHMELKGLLIDESGLRQYRNELKQEEQELLSTLNNTVLSDIDIIEEQLAEEERSKRKSEIGKARILSGSEKYKTKFNWQSPQHVSNLLFKQLKLPTEAASTTATGRPSITEASLESVYKTLPDTSSKERLVLDTYSRYKKNQKLLTTYTGEDRGLLSEVENGHIYSEYLQAGRGKEGTKGGTVTGRLSSRSPNMQNLPRGSKIKAFFKPSAGNVFVYFDYSQLELRIAAHLSKDPLLIKGYNHNIDLHQLTADDLGVDRQVGKTINFAMIYNASPYRLMKELGDEYTIEQCTHFKNGFFEQFNVYQKYLKEQYQQMVKTGYVVSEFGRVRRLPELLKAGASYKDKEFKHAINQGFNFPIQSFGASITKRAMIELHNKGYDIRTQVHDSVVIEISRFIVEKELPKIKSIAENVYKLIVPLKVDIKVLTSLSESDTLELEKSEVKKEIINGTK